MEEKFKPYIILYNICMKEIEKILLEELKNKGINNLLTTGQF